MKTTNNNIQIFNNSNFGTIRTITNAEGETFFVGRDVATALGYSNTRDALNRHVDKEDRDGVVIHDSIGRQQKAVAHPLLAAGAGAGLQALGHRRGAAADPPHGALRDDRAAACAGGLREPTRMARPNTLWRSKHATGSPCSSTCANKPRSAKCSRTNYSSS